MPDAVGIPPPEEAPTEPVEREGAIDSAGNGRAAALTLAALGIVFGDIGTSPLYALQTVFAIEGGIMALTALVQRARAKTATLVLLGVVGAALFYGDGMITPAISVLSAVEGLKVAAPSLEHLVIPITLAILAALFAIQRWGTHRVGGVFGPVMAVWFVILATAGLREVIAHPGILKGLSPSYAVAFIVDHPGVAFIAMGAVVLVITGAEALYADMGHFGGAPIRRAWFMLVFRR